MIIVHGDSPVELSRLVDASRPTFYFLDAHWRGGTTAGVDAQCPVLDELDAIRRGNERDCIVIDDARLFSQPPPPALNPAQWPTIGEIVSRLRAIHPKHDVGVVDDQVVSVPAHAWWIAELWRDTVKQGLRPLRAQLLRLAPTRVARRLRSTLHHRLPATRLQRARE